MTEIVIRSVWFKRLNRVDIIHFHVSRVCYIFLLLSEYSLCFILTLKQIHSWTLSVKLNLQIFYRLINWNKSRDPWLLLFLLIFPLKNSHNWMKDFLQLLVRCCKRPEVENDKKSLSDWQCWPVKGEHRENERRWDIKILNTLQTNISQFWFIISTLH